MLLGAGVHHTGWFWAVYCAVFECDCVHGVNQMETSACLCECFLLCLCCVRGAGSQLKRLQWLSIAVIVIGLSVSAADDSSSGNNVTDKVSGEVQLHLLMS